MNFYGPQKDFLDNSHSKYKLEISPFLLFLCAEPKDLILFWDWIE